MLLQDLSIKVVFHVLCHADLVRVLMHFAEDLALGCVLDRTVLNCNLQVPDPEFEGQTKTRLGNPEVRKIVEGIVSQVGLLLSVFQGPYLLQYATCLLAGQWLLQV